MPGDQLRDILSRRTPDGYYLVPLRNTPEARRLAEEHGGVFEEAGDVLYVKLRSRSLAARLARRAAARGLLAPS